MSIYDDILNKFDDGLIIKIEPGAPIKLRMLDHPYVSSPQFDNGDVATRFSWPVWDYAQGRVRILQQGKSVFKQIVNTHKTWPNGADMPSPFDITITRTGSGKNDTEYVVVPTPYIDGVPSKRELPDMADKTKGIPLEDVYKGKTPPVYSVSSGQLNAGALPSGDVVIKDLSDDAEINLADIPF